MGATDELRRMLDERGVEYRREGCEFSFVRDRHSIHIWAMDDENLCASIAYLSPEQAIAATLGPGTCRDLVVTPDYRDKTKFVCSECGYEYSAVGGFGCDSGDEPDFRFCPNCGRRVEVGG